MKILFLVHQFYPECYTGTEKFVFNMAKMMQTTGHHVKVVTYSFYKDESYDRYKGNVLIKNLIYEGVPVLAFKYITAPDDLNDGLSSTSLSRLAKKILAQENPDIIHAGHSMRVAQFIKEAARKKIPYIMTLTDFWLLCPKTILATSMQSLCSGPEQGNTCSKYCPELRQEAIQTRLEDARQLLFGAQKVFSPSSFLASVFKKEFPELDVGVINHGMRFSSIKKNRKVYTKDTPLTFFYGGSFNYHKGVHVLIDAFKEVDSTRIALKIYGAHGDYVSEIENAADEDPRIELCGLFSEDQIGKILSSVDIAIIPSLWYENYPLVLHEALACNVPVIASNAGGMAERIKDGENGFLFQIGNTENLNKILTKIAANPTILNVLKEKIKNTFTPSIEQEAYAYEKDYHALQRK